MIRYIVSKVERKIEFDIRLMIGDEMDGFFELKTATDLREKLRRDFAKVEVAPLDVDAFFNFLLTAEHMADWVLPGKANRTAREALRDGSTLLQVCSHLANGGKHFRVEAKHHDSVASAKRVGPDPPGFWPPGFLPPGFFPEFLCVVLHGRAAVELGDSIEAKELARQVLAIWDAHPLI